MKKLPALQFPWGRPGKKCRSFKHPPTPPSMSNPTPHDTDTVLSGLVLPCHCPKVKNAFPFVFPPPPLSLFIHCTVCNHRF